MSLINSVLKDIELKPSGFKQVDLGTSELNVQARKLGKPKWHWLLSLLILVLLAIYWGSVDQLQVLENKDFVIEIAKHDDVIELKKTLDLTSPEQSSIAEIMEIPEQIVTSNNKITGLQLKESSDSLLLQFQFLQKADSFLKFQSERQYRFYIKNVNLEIQPPQINNRWLKQLDLEPQGGGVDIMINTRHSILVESEWVSLNDSPHWQIKLTLSKPDHVKQLSKNEQLTVIVKTENQPKLQQNVKNKIAPKQLQETNSDIATAEIKVSIKPSVKNLSSEQRLQHAIRLMQARQWDNAEIELLALLNGDQDQRARLKLLSLYSKLQKVSRHTELLSESVHKYPQAADFKTEQAIVMFRQGQYSSIVNLLGGKNNRDATQHALLGASYQRLEKHQKAIKSYQQSIVKAPGSAKNWIALAISQEQEHLYTDALNAYKNAARLDGINARLRNYIQNRMQQLQKKVNP